MAVRAAEVRRANIVYMAVTGVLCSEGGELRLKSTLTRLKWRWGDYYGRDIMIHQPKLGMGIKPRFSGAVWEMICGKYTIDGRRVYLSWSRCRIKGTANLLCSV